MFEFHKYRGWAIGISLILLVSACVPSAQQDSTISTAVAQTVQAQNTKETVLTATSPVSTDTPVPLTSLTATVTGTPLTQVAAGLCDASASLVGETVPDGTIIQPGETFTKVWQIQNSGTCTWDSSWQLTFYNGDQMDGLATYNFPQPAQPGQTLEIPIILRAPAGNGTHTGEWMLTSPWGESFGVGSYSVPISVSIVVGSATPENKRTATVYGVTGVTYQIDRRCDPANTVYTITTFITTNGPAEVTFTWVQSDGNNKKNNRLSFTEASTKSAQREWIQHSTSSSPNRRWISVIINSPTYQEFEQAILPKLCGQE
jgi:hypothetical protein